MRLCRAKGTEAIFHKWAEVSQVIPPSPMVGGHPGGEIRYATAIVEFIHNGQVTEVMANDVVFCDTEDVTKELSSAANSCRICDDMDLIHDIVCYIPNDDGGATDVPINCCPNCGRKLD